MRMPKRIIALVMAIALITTCGVSTAFAAVRVADSTVNITVTSNTHGTVTTTVGGEELSTAVAGDVVTIVAIPDNGYYVSSIRCEEVRSGKTVHVTKTGSRSGRFTMPAVPVEVIVNFVRNSNHYDDYDRSSSTGHDESAYEREFDGTKMELAGGEFVSAKTVEEISGRDKVYTVHYRGKDYTFNGKDIPEPASSIIYYTAEEFMELVRGKLITATGTVGGSGNPDTGANDFVGLAMALGVISLAGIAVCSVAKKK